MNRRLACSLLTVLSSFVAAAEAGPVNPAVHAETDALLGRLAASGCRFERNGTWYDAAAARSHLQDKRDYVESHGTLASTEQFIDVAASRSSMSGKAYHVQCAGGPVVESGTWLMAQLKQLRGGPVSK